jgi:hypothetical protein
MSYGRYRRLSQNPGVNFTTRILSANHISHTYRPHTVFLARAIHQPIESSYLSQFYTHLYLRITITFTVAPARHRRVSRNPLAKYIYSLPPRYSKFPSPIFFQSLQTTVALPAPTTGASALLFIRPFTFPPTRQYRARRGTHHRHPAIDRTSSPRTTREHQSHDSRLVQQGDLRKS